MGKILNTAAAALTAGSLVGCGESAIEQEAQIVGFGWGVDAAIVEDQWVGYSNQDNLPSGQVRDLEETEEFVGCREVFDFGFGFDDFECYVSWCTSGEDSHCEAVYEPRYSYERFEEAQIRDCPAPIKPLEYKPASPVSDEECAAAAEPHQRIKQVGRYVIWAQAQNPNHDPSKPSNGPAYLSATENVTAAEWEALDRQTPVTATIIKGNIADLSLSS